MVPFAVATPSVERPTRFALPRETFDAVLYLFLGIYKIAILVFNLVPYIALRIVARG